MTHLVEQNVAWLRAIETLKIEKCSKPKPNYSRSFSQKISTQPFSRLWLFDWIGNIAEVGFRVPGAPLIGFTVGG